MIMAMEGRDRKLNRRDWPGFLRRLVPQGVWQAFSHDHCPSEDPRVRWSRKFIVLVYIAMGWAERRTLAGRFTDARQWVIGLFPWRRRPGNTYVGLTKAAGRHGVAMFQSFWAHLRQTIPKRLNESWREYGWILFAVDGSRIDAPRTRSNERALGRSARDKSHPQWWMTWLVHLPTLLLWDWRQGPGTSSEREHMRQMLPSLPQGALIVADAGFGGFDFMNGLIHSGVSFLIRCGGNTTLLTNLAKWRIEQRGDVRYVYWWPGNRRRYRPLQLRLIILKRGGSRVYLVTNVCDTKRLSRSMAGELYELRWGAEVNYRDFKRTMEHSAVLAGSPECGALELAGDIVAMGLLRLHAAILQLSRGARISVARMLDLLRTAMEHLRYAAPTDWVMPAIKSAITDDYHRKRPKNSRDWPRKKRHRIPSSPIFRRLKQSDWLDIQARFYNHDSRLG